MQIEKPYNINSTTNISDSNFPLERTKIKYQNGIIVTKTHSKSIIHLNAMEI